MARETFYWDSNAFSGYLNEEAGKVDECDAVLKEAAKGRVLIVTSALTIAEVLFIRQGPKLPPEKRDEVEKFFKADYINVRNVTRQIADLARDVFWDHGIKPKDAVHVATAAAFKLPVMNTFDAALIGKSGLVIDIPGGSQHRLEIKRPYVPHQLDLTYEKQDDDGD